MVLWLLLCVMGVERDSGICRLLITKATLQGRCACSV